MLDIQQLRLSDMRVVRLYFDDTFRDHVVHKSEVDKFVEASKRLHVDPGVNPHRPPGEGKTARINRITVGSFQTTGPFWWTTPDLQNNRDPVGATIYQSDYNEVTVWSSQREGSPGEMPHRVRYYCSG
jgi:hypothetical protein